MHIYGSSVSVFANKYSAWHNAIISKAKSSSRVKYEGTYYESHHIVPTAMGGPDTDANQVLLTAREHFLVHWLLTKMVMDHEHLRSMYRAISMMKAENAQHQRALTSWQYEVSRKAAIAAQTGVPSPNKGRPHSDEHRANLSKSHKGKTLSDEHKAKLRAAKMGNKNRVGCTHTDASRKRMSEVKIGVPRAKKDRLLAKNEASNLIPFMG